MSVKEPPELKAFRELEVLVRHLGDELATFRRRALAAETQLKDVEAGQVPSRSRASAGDHHELEDENRALRGRVERAEERIRQLMDRVRFLRQQMQLTTSSATRSG
ncbi:MAG TPA: hypothetical protein VJ867_11660 [Gemmatimonadaceae bacterium]|nr:hypothetical protein [Gemmatimonadaceae bacterium]